MERKLADISGISKTLLMQSSSNCTVPDPWTPSYAGFPTLIWEIWQSDGDCNDSLVWVIWWDAPESNIQLFEDACEPWADKAFPLPDDEGLNTKILCFFITSFNASSFL